VNKRLWTKYYVGAALGVGFLASPAAAQTNLLVAPGFTGGVPGPAWATGGGFNATVTRVGAAARFQHTPGSGEGGFNSVKQTNVRNNNPNLLLIPGNVYKLSGNVKFTGSPLGSFGFSVQDHGPSFGFNTNRRINFSSILGPTSHPFSLIFQNGSPSTTGKFATYGEVTFFADFFNGAQAPEFLFVDPSLTDLSASGVPEVDPGNAAMPVALATGALALALDKRKRRDSEE
jgi:hypothetical protein